MEEPSFGIQYDDEEHDQNEERLKISLEDCHRNFCHVTRHFIEFQISRGFAGAFNRTFAIPSQGENSSLYSRSESKAPHFKLNTLSKNVIEYNCYYMYENGEIVEFTGYFYSTKFILPEIHDNMHDTNFVRESSRTSTLSSIFSYEDYSPIQNDSPVQEKLGITTDIISSQSSERLLS